MAAGLVAIGVVLATRPVGDEALRAHATASAAGTVDNAQSFWPGQYLVTLSWAAGSQDCRARFVLPQSSPPWSEPGDVDLLFDPNHPGTVVLADPSWSLNSDFRWSAAFESVVPFTMSALAMALLVIWPTRKSSAFTIDSIRRARRSLRRYVLTPAVTGTLAVAALVVIQEQSLLAYSSAVDNLTGELSLLLVIGLIWPCVRAVRFGRLRRLLTVVDDAADGAAVIAAAAGRRLHIDTNAADSSDGDQVADHRSAVRVVALKGQSTDSFRPGTTVGLYGRWKDRGPALVTDGETVVIGRGSRRETADRMTDSLERQYPALRRELRSYLVGQSALLIIVSGVSVAVVVLARLNPGWLWLPVNIVWPSLIAVAAHYSGMHGLLRRPYAASHGVVLSVAASRWRRRITAMIQVPDEPVQKWRLVAKRGRWLAEGQDVVVLRRAGSFDTAAIATSAGLAAFAVSRTAKPNS